jgi:hypothetical protein
MFPGGGAAAQIGMQEINRAIKAVGNYAGIGIEGLKETFVPTGGSQLASHGWVSRIAGGLAGAHPELPNTAGKAATPGPIDPGPAISPESVLNRPPPPAAATGAKAVGGPTNGVYNEAANTVTPGAR